MGCHTAKPDIVLPIAGIDAITHKGICAVLPNGKRIWLPKDHCEPIPGALVVPGWLIRKIRKHEGKADAN